MEALASHDAPRPCQRKAMLSRDGFSFSQNKFMLEGHTSVKPSVCVCKVIMIH